MSSSLMLPTEDYEKAITVAAAQPKWTFTKVTGKRIMIINPTTAPVIIEEV